MLRSHSQLLRLDSDQLHVPYGFPYLLHGPDNEQPLVPHGHESEQPCVTHG